MMRHLPLMAMAAAIGSIVIIGALIAAAESSDALTQYLGLAAIVLASATIVAGFAMADRMLAAHRRKDGE